MRKILLGLILVLGINSLVMAGGYYKTYAVDYDSTTIRTDVMLDGNYYLVKTTSAIADIIDNDADPLSYSDVAMESGGKYPLKLYNGDLQVVTTGYGITFPDGSLQITAGVGSAYNTLSSTGTVIINSDSDASGDEPIIFRTKGASERMRIGSDPSSISFGTSGLVNGFRFSGASSSNARLYLQNQSYSTANSDEGLFMLDNSGNLNLYSSASGSGTPKDMIFNYHGTVGGEAMRISNTGRLGIGTTAPAELLDVNGSIALEGTAIIDYDNSSYAIKVSTQVLIPTTTRYYDTGIGGLTGDGYVENSVYGYIYPDTLNSISGIQQINLPDGAKITEVETFWYREDTSCSGQTMLYRSDGRGSSADGLAGTSTNTNGYHSVVDTSIMYPIIDNKNYNYYLYINLDAGAATHIWDIRYLNTKITYTIDEPLP